MSLLNRVAGHDDSGNTSALVGRARRGDRGALGVLLERFHPRVLRIVRRRMGPRLREQVESADVVQDTMVEMIRSLREMDPRRDGAYLRWIAGVVENRLRNAHRGLVRRSIARAPEVDARVQTAASGELPERAAAREEERDLVARALEQLSEEHRRVIQMRHYARLSHREIGAQIGRSEDASSMLYTRAKARLAREVYRLRRDVDD